MDRIFVRHLTVAVFSFAFASTAGAAEPRFEYNGYWRLGLNTAGNPTEEASDTQGYDQFGDIKTTRHARNPSYFWIRAGRIFENDWQAVIKIDSNATLPHEYGNWGDAETNIIRVRDLYLQIPISSESYLWAGSKYLEWEDIRLFDYLNYFNLNAHGAGAKLGNTHLVLSSTKETLAGSKVQVHDANGNTVTEDPANPFSQKRKNTQLMARHELSLGTGMAIKPMAKFVRYGTAPENTADPNRVYSKVKGANEFAVGGVFSTWSESHWANTHLWLGATPDDTSGQSSVKTNVFGIGYSASHNYQSFGVLAALWSQHEKFQDKRDTFKIENGALVADGKTTSATTKVSVGLQPVYYVTDKVHGCLDLNYAFKDKKASATDYNVLLVTPIVRYAVNKNPLGTPQIYTSVSYGSYDWKAKIGADGKPTKNLVTTQTGFEAWF